MRATGKKGSLVPVPDWEQCKGLGIGWGCQISRGPTSCLQNFPKAGSRSGSHSREQLTPSLPCSTLPVCNLAFSEAPAIMQGPLRKPFRGWQVRKLLGNHSFSATRALKKTRAVSILSTLPQPFPFRKRKKSNLGLHLSLSTARVLRKRHAQM